MVAGSNPVAPTIDTRGHGTAPRPFVCAGDGRRTDDLRRFCARRRDVQSGARFRQSPHSIRESNDFFEPGKPLRRSGMERQRQLVNAVSFPANAPFVVPLVAELVTGHLGPPGDGE